MTIFKVVIVVCAIVVAVVGAYETAACRCRHHGGDEQ